MVTNTNKRLQEFTETQQQKNHQTRNELRKWKNHFRKQQELIFLRRCLNSGYVLPTFTRKNQPLKYAVEWQRDRVQLLEQELSKEQAIFSRLKWDNLPKSSREKLKKFKFFKKKNFIEKFNKITSFRTPDFKVVRKVSKQRKKQDRLGYKKSLKKIKQDNPPP